MDKGIKYPIRPEWVRLSPKEGGGFKCPKCEHWSLTARLNYCPICGKNMMRSEDNE